jgi:hypothetical protein
MRKCYEAVEQAEEHPATLAAANDDTGATGVRSHEGPEDVAFKVLVHPRRRTKAKKTRDSGRLEQSVSDEGSDLA